LDGARLVDGLGGAFDLLQLDASSRRDERHATRRQWVAGERIRDGGAAVMFRAQHRTRFIRALAVARIAVMTLATSSFLGAQTPRFAPVGDPLPDGFGSASAACDVDGDGDLDLVGTAHVLLNEGRGFFSTGPSTSTAPFLALSSLKAADLNGDQQADLLVTGLNGFISSEIAVALANGAGGYLPGVFVPGAGSRPALGDVDGDGDLDLQSQGGAQWRLYLNDGAGGFTAAPASYWSSAASANGWSAFADFDGDGALDAIAGANTGVRWRRNLGGSFAAPALLSTLGTTGLRSAAFGDFDGDGFVDLVFEGTAGAHRVVRGGAAGPAVDPPPSSLAGTVASLMAGDVNGDGFDDVVRVSDDPPGAADFPAPSVVRLRLGSSTGLGPPSFVASHAADARSGEAAGDFDGDGDLDLVLTPLFGESSLLLADGAGGFARAPQPLPPVPGADAVLPPADVDGDGDSDVVVAWTNGTTAKLGLLRNDGRGEFATNPELVAAFPGFSTGAVAWADFDGDGALDLYWTCANTFPATDVVLRNDGAGVFTTATTVMHQGVATATIARDFDGDGDLDVAASLIGLPPFLPQVSSVVIRNTSPGPGLISFAAPVAIGAPTNATCVAAFDFEPDGDLDLCLSAGLPQRPGVSAAFLNDGLGGFAPTSLVSPTPSRSAAAGDLDGDGDGDLVLDFGVLLSVGGALVAGPGVPPATIGGTQLFDADGDGDPDLVDATTRWFENTGGGAFGPAQEIAAVAIPSNFFSYGGPTTADVDGDGDLDLFPAPRITSPGPFSLMHNLTRHAGSTSVVRQGGTASLSLWGAPGELWFLAASAVPTTAPLALPPYGTLHLDLLTTTIVASGVFGSGARADLFATVPAGPTFVGTTLLWQGSTAPRFTNAFETTVLP
jgi:hypothetical protein